MLTSLDIDLIINKGKYYPQETNQFGIPTRNVFCDRCSRSGISGSWKVAELPDVDICMQCYIQLQHQQTQEVMMQNTKSTQPVFHPLIPDLHTRKTPSSRVDWNGWNIGGGNGAADYNQVWNKDCGIPNSYANIVIDDVMQDNYK